MPRSSPFVIELTAAERCALETVSAKYTSPYFSVLRARVALFAAQHLDNKEISIILGLPRQTVSKWRKRFYYDRLAGLTDRARPGRPRNSNLPCVTAEPDSRTTESTQ